MSPGEDTTLLAADDAAREAALDVRRSFVVQAPAGSGKTELLIQRILALLAVVDRPERVLAITFTRKAAGEMRERVVRALASAREPVDEASLQPHELKTRELARAALARDRAEGWNLILHPSRLAIQTIDALAQAIALQAPLASGLPPAPRFTDDARPLHLAAARAAIVEAAADDPRWRRLLEHQDNDADALAGRIVDLLARRDQWRTLATAGAGDLRTILERTLRAEVEGELAQIAGTIARADFRPVAAVARAVVAHLGPGDEALARTLEACADAGDAPKLRCEAIDAWRELAGWLLKQDGRELRKSPSKMRGVPVVGQGPGREARRTHYSAVRECLEALGTVPGLSGALATVASLPPTRYDDEVWERIAALLSLLPRFAARLELEFLARREFDFPKGTLGALAALGDADAPTDLLLRLDLRIEHLLVDEFQDTSYAHLDLIGRLVAGWSGDDGRTLFAVGDPMQSIYKFRGAEVRAFVEAITAGAIEGVPVERLTLRRNFRSHSGLVDWVNARFPAVLGGINEPWQGRVAFADAIAVRPVEPGEAVTLDVARDEAAEAAFVVVRVKEALGRGDRVAILVRARTHLGAVLAALRDAAIPYSAVDLDVLADRPAVRDLVALTHAIVQPDDRLAWLALLRAPWCGLVLADLHAIVRAADGTPPGAIDDVAAAPPPALSDDGRARLARVTAAVEEARRDRSVAPLVERVHRAWIALGGPATIGEALDLVAVDDVLGLVAAHERAGDIPDWSAFTARLAEARLSPPPGDDARVQVMTMHKAKGLEFDTVILPGLARGRTRSDSPFMRWRTRRNGLMVGLGRPRGGNHEGVYAYLQTLAAGEDEAELARLAYVACTRARRRLALVAVLKPSTKAPGEWKAPGRGAILGLFDAAILGLAEHPPEGGEGAPGTVAPEPPAIARVPVDWSPPVAQAPLVGSATLRTVEPGLPFDWARERARRLGVVVHQVLAQVGTDGLDRWDRARLAAQAAPIEAALVTEGALPSEAGAEVADVVATVASVLADRRGRWLFDASHADARSEWALTGVDGGDVVHVVLDRSFVADGVRWIVDFKTGTHEGADAADFLDAEAERYRPQLDRYARIVAALDSSLPVRLALYHPRVPGGWREWSP